MLNERFSRQMKDFQGDIFFDEPLKNHSTFKIGGNAEILYIPKNEKALIAAVNFSKENDIPFHILGNGSNVLISDNGLKGIVIKLFGGLTDLLYLGDGIIAVGAGVSLTRLCNFALEKSLTGLEFAYGIPGTVGGAVYMNAGAYGGEIKDVLMSVRTFNPDTGEVKEEPVQKVSLSYRDTSFMHSGDIITAAFFKLEKGEKEAISEKMLELMTKRKTSQPLEFPSAGSTFKRPPNAFAAALIDQCGLKGLTVGGAKVSEKHAGFVINFNNASFDDVITLMDKIKAIVLKERGIELTPEVEILR